MPIEEYVKDAPAKKGVRVLVEMKSIQSDMTGVGFFTLKKDAPESLLSEVKGGEKLEYELASEGIIELSEGRLSLSYEENAIEGSEGCSTVISFDVAAPECVTVERRGLLSSVFVISKGERLFSLYSTPYGALDMCIYAKKVENTLTEEGGALFLDYAVELKGLTAQRTRMEVKVRKLLQ
ncbi:MAG: DUF1934 domain-containing protein [Ruminococcaceae bacterium]|nr:DUF1934 domain-containing protein [Oscillospiraceae bacterium]